MIYLNWRYYSLQIFKSCLLRILLGPFMVHSSVVFLKYLSDRVELAESYKNIRVVNNIGSTLYSS